MPYVISNCSNNYGPNQFPEKLLPLFINNIRNGKSLPVYGDGKFTRDWLYVVDHAIAIDKIYHEGRNAETYNIGGFNEWTNIDLLNVLCEKVALNTNKPKNYYKKLITYVKDRAGHDRRYAINCDKIKNELGWQQSVSFDEGLEKTVKWYLDNKEWMERIKSGEYRSWIEKNYE
jgi:dTDP-glucose 4,6-dehydratase